MTPSDFLQRVTSLLDQADVPYMVTGSIASSYHGKPRATFDLDIVIAPDEGQLDNFIQSLGQSYYANQESAANALARRGMFNIVDYQTGSKADFVILKDRDYSREEFRRRSMASVMGVNCYVVSAEDSVLSKLEWAKLGESERQLNDVVEVCRVVQDRLDISYLKRWAKQLGVQDLLVRALAEAGL